MGMDRVVNWPLQLVEGDIVLRPLRWRDGPAWREVRAANQEWLRPWEATNPDHSTSGPTFRQMVSRVSAEARAGRQIPLAIEYLGDFVGQVNVSGIVWGSFRSGYVGYWVDYRVAGRGIMPTAVAMETDYCFFVAGLHRLEINIRPENRASLRVVEKLGYRPEGLRRRYLHIAGDWRDHSTFSMTADDAPTGVLPGWRQYLADRRSDELGRHVGRAWGGSTDGQQGSPWGVYLDERGPQWGSGADGDGTLLGYRG